MSIDKEIVIKLSETIANRRYKHLIFNKFTNIDEFDIKGLVAIVKNYDFLLDGLIADISMFSSLDHLVLKHSELKEIIEDDLHIAINNPVLSNDILMVLAVDNMNRYIAEQVTKKGGDNG
jgi:hypothetical protein